MTRHGYFFKATPGLHRRWVTVPANGDRDQRVPRQLQGPRGVHAESDLCCFLRWCQSGEISPLAARRVDLELYLRWMQNDRRFKPSTVSRRLSVVAGFYRTCVIDGVFEQSPAAYVRCP